MPTIQTRHSHRRRPLVIITYVYRVLSGFLRIVITPVLHCKRDRTKFDHFKTSDRHLNKQSDTLVQGAAAALPSLTNYAVSLIFANMRVCIGARTSTSAVWVHTVSVVKRSALCLASDSRYKKQRGNVFRPCGFQFKSNYIEQTVRLGS